MGDREMLVSADGTATEAEYLQAWLTVGQQNIWIREAVDPPFTLACFSHGESIPELLDRFAQERWCLGQAFYRFDAKQPNKALCFIEQVSGGDAWLAIKERLPFESVSFGLILRKKGRTSATERIARMQRATLPQCWQLEY